MVGGLWREYQGYAETRANRPDRMQWFWIRLIEADQGHRFAIDRNLRRSIEQSRREARIVAAQAGRRRVRSSSDAPVSGGGVMHGVVKTSGRDLALRGGQRGADVVKILAVSRRRCKYSC